MKENSDKVKIQIQGKFTTLIKHINLHQVTDQLFELLKVVGNEKNNVELEGISPSPDDDVSLIPILCEENTILKRKVQQLEVNIAELLT